METFADIKVEQDGSGRFDFVIGSTGDFEAEDGLDSALYVSLLTDARADASQVIDAGRRRGWLGNTVNPVDGRQLGGLLWLVEQGRLNTDTLNAAVSFARSSLDWMVEDGLAKNVTVTGEIVPRSGIALTITVTTPDGSTETRYIKLWEVTGDAT